MNVKKHFDNQSMKYYAGRKKGILGKLVDIEKKAVLKHLQPQQGEQILDAGSGSGYYSYILRNRGAIPFGIDFSEKMITILKKNGIQGTVANVEQFNLHKTFDKILCTGVLEFLQNPSHALTCFSHHLKKNGSLILLYPRPSFFGYLYRLYHKSHHFSINLFTSTRMQELLRQAGFTTHTCKNVDPFMTLIKAVKT